VLITLQYHLQTSTPLSESSEGTPLLQRVENIGSFSNSTEQHSKESMGKSVTDISAMQCKAKAEEESEKSPLLSPRDPSGEDFRVPNHSARKIKPFQNLPTEGRAGMLSPLKEQQSIPTDNSVLVNSPRNKEKQKTRSSFFTNCMCCHTYKLMFDLCLLVFFHILSGVFSAWSITLSYSLVIKLAQ
jgi:hypothetical protein